MQLAIDTSTAWSSIALMDGERAVASDEMHGVNPGDAVVSRIDQLLRGVDVGRESLTGIVVGVGPGPYTSTRIGVAIARTLGFALGLEVAGVCSHDAVAAQFVGEYPEVAADDFIVATDARRREVYWARYDGEGRRQVGPTVGKPAEVVAAYEYDSFVGNGLDRYPELAADAGITIYQPSHPSARWVAAVAAAALDGGQAIPTTQPVLADHAAGSSLPFDRGQRLFAPFPLYLRRPDAVPSAGGASR